jgi:hypothetical protein
MLRASVRPAPPEAEREHPVFGPGGQAKLRAIEISDVWLALRAGIHAQREALLSTPLTPGRGETLQSRWGAIQQLSILLHGGPQMILQYSQLAEKAGDDEQEREYIARAHTFEG